MTSIKLSKRLNEIAKLVNKDSILADVGCDHALLDIYLIQNKIIKKSVACDITTGALEGAKKKLLLNNISDNKIELRLADGLTAINKEDKIDTLVISGLGNQKIVSILKDGYSKLENINCIIIQSNTGVYHIRRQLVELGYYIEDEVLIKERNIIYTIIKFYKGKKRYSKKEILYGPILINKQGRLFEELLKNKINKNNYVIKKLPKNKMIKKIRLKIENKKIKNIIKH